jgi:GntP family gluconate:H+ symporter
MVILIACAGGAFGALLNEAGIGKAIELVAKTHNLNLILLAYGAGLIMRMAQGSVTGAMIAVAPMIYPMLSKDLPYHPVYVFLAIGYGALFVSWMNDGGFWVISRLGGFTEKQTLASWTVLTAVISVSGLLATIILAALLPLRGSP